MGCLPFSEKKGGGGDGVAEEGRLGGGTGRRGGREGKLRFVSEKINLLK